VEVALGKKFRFVWIPVMGGICLFLFLAIIQVTGCKITQVSANHAGSEIMHADEGESDYLEVGIASGWPQVGEKSWDFERFDCDIRIVP